MGTVLHVPLNKLFYIGKLFAFISTDEQGNEGVCAFFDRYSGTMLPMIGADMDRVESLRPLAQQLAQEYAKTKRKISLVVFETRREVEEIKP